MVIDDSILHGCRCNGTVQGPEGAVFGARVLGASGLALIGWSASCELLGQPMGGQARPRRTRALQASTRGQTTHPMTQLEPTGPGMTEGSWEGRVIGSRYHI